MNTSSGSPDNSARISAAAKFNSICPPHAGHLPRRPAKAAFTRNTFPQPHVATMDMTVLPRQARNDGMDEQTPLALHIPEARFRPGDTPDFGYLSLPKAGGGFLALSGGRLPWSAWCTIRSSNHRVRYCWFTSTRNW